MNFNIQDILKDKKMLAMIGGGLLVFIIIIVLIVALAGGNKSDKIKEEPKIKEPLTLLKTDNLGKAIEIQALLARSNITAYRKEDGSKSEIYIKDYTLSQRDMALLEIVKSGLMDQYVGLEIFDKGDFTSTKDDKRIRLARAINGELARLIRKIPPIENASVFISIPEPTMFTADKKPVTATVQLVVPSGIKLEANKIKAIENLLLGSVTGLETANISITDTNGNVYNSMINSIDDQMSKLQENDMYMQNKVSAQLDRLIGKGNYVVTVSTFLRQIPVEKTSIIYDPKKKASVSEQTFSEGLGDSTQDSSNGLGAVSVYVPNGIQSSNANSSQDRSYSRSAKETQFGVSKTQVSEYIRPGIIEDISIAVTIDEGALPASITEDELKNLIASSASPKVSADNVSIAYSESIKPYLASDRPVNLPKPEASGNPWWLAIIIIIGGLAGGFYFVQKKLKASSVRQKEELEKLRAKTQEQEKQILDVNLKAAQLIEKQAMLAQNLVEQKMQRQLEQKKPSDNENEVNNALEDLSSDIAFSGDDEAIDKLKNWIEKS